MVISVAILIFLILPFYKKVNENIQKMVVSLFTGYQIAGKNA
jgi:hypothetical protein